MSAQDPGPDYCWQCGGDHPSATHDYGRVIKAGNALAVALATDRLLYGFSVETSEGERIAPQNVQWRNGFYEIVKP